MGRFALVGLLLSVACACSGPARAQQPVARPIVAVQPLAEGLWMAAGGGGGNVLLSAGADGALIVDALYGRYTHRLLEVADSLSGGGRVRFLVNTHYHGDHVDGDSIVAAAGAAILAHESVRRRMSVTQFNTTVEETIRACPAQALPVLTFADSVTLFLNGREIRVLRLPPGHTEGDVIVWVPSADVVHLGDIFFNGYYPVIDVFGGGSIAGLIRQVNLALRSIGPATKIIPGHGPLADRAALLRYREMLMTVRDRITRLVREGRTLEQLQAEKPLADLDAIWGRGYMNPDFFLRTLHSDLVRTRAPGRSRR